MKKNLLQALLFTVVTGLASTISANASNDSIRTIAKQKTITATANTFDKLYPNPDKPFEPVDPIGPVHPIDPGDPILPIDPGDPVLPIHPNKPVMPTPPTSTSSTYDVGSPKGALSVNNSGAAVYSINISAPNGGSLTPSIGVSYNSQSGNGLAGFGFNITGLSCITRGCKDLYHDKQIVGTSYGIGDALFLNGQRLILKTGTYGYNGSTYTPEGDPYTIVTLHNNINTNACWFSVVCADGKTYQLGNTSDSRLSFVNRKSVTCIAAWYINQTTDVHSNLIKYHYTTTNYNLRPVSIEYGLNTAKSRGITNLILFTYSSLTGSYARPFAIGDRQGKMDVYLSKITTQTNGSVFRTYTFTYNSTSDGTKDKYYRLTQVDLANGAGRKVAPIKINWEYLPSLYIYNTNLNVQTSSPYSMIEESAKTFIAVDVNNDGISDIIRLSPGAYVQRYNGGESRQEKTFLFVSLSKKDANGNVTYQTPKQFDLDPSFSMNDLNNVIGGIQAMDFDGDGYNDLIIPYYCGYKSNYGERYTIVWGKSIVDGGGFSEITSGLVNCDHTPLFTTYDSNGDGRDDLFYLEDRAKDGYYNGAILRYKDRNSLDVTKFQFKLDSDPKKLFVGDYNHDGLTDIIVFYDGGYKIYYNNGGELSSTKYTEYNSKKGTSLGDKHRIVQGDFDGDGMIDFAFSQGDWEYGLAINNGDGTFTVNNKTVTLSETDQNTNKDNDRFNMVAYDFDHDGKCDFVITKAHYVFHGGFRSKYYYDFTKTLFVRSTGTGFELHKEYVTHQEKDAEPNNIFLGDFTGDGDVQYASFGKNLLVDNDESDDKIHTYRSGYNLVSKGKISSITDGFGLLTYINYKSATDPSVYTQTHFSAYPVNSYTIPAPLVSKVIKGNGAAGSQSIQYQYGDLKLHVAGKGTVGFSSMTTENLTLGIKETTTVDKWDTDKWIPLQTTTTSTVGGNSSKIISYTTIANNISGQNYYAYTSRKSLTDLDGNTSETYTTYDTAKGVPTVEIVKNDGDNMYKKVVYNSYIQKMNQWMPLNVVKSQKHEDDAEVNSSTTTYTYNDKGEVIKVVANDGSTLPLTINTTYDVYGNVLTSTQTGKGIVANTETNVYDASGRFVVKAYDSVSPRVTTYTYDLFGNVLTENDETNKSHILTSKHVYDGWGTEISETNSFGITTTKEMGWGSYYGKKYFITTSSTGKPWVAVWFDNAGHEVLQESVMQNVNAYSLATTYNSKGQKTKIEEKTGKLTLSETFTYDERGRVTSDVKSSGKSSTFSYGNRSVTETTAGRSYTKVTDAWGNLVKSVDPVTQVDYVYSSIGKPAEITTNGATTHIQYDEVGNKIAIQSPDAGNINYEYAADGKVMKFTDARNITTTYTYDAEGRLASTKAGNTFITNTYGTSGNSINHLVKTSVNGNSVEYTHDELGRVITETRTVNGDGTYQFKYAYNAKNQLIQTTYPGNLVVKYKYDEYGNKIQTTANDKIVYQVDSYDGLETRTSFLNKYTTTFTLDSRGFKSDIVLKNGSTVLDQFKMNYEGSTGNLLSRTHNSLSEETFGYDNLDRLVSVKVGTKETMHIKYADNGNITSKTGIGQYYYNAERPHAVASVDNTDNLISTQACITQFNDLNKISSLQENDKVMTIDYGPDLERCFSILKQGNTILRKVTYMGDYEKVVANGVTREYYYLDGDVIVVQQNGTFHAYQSFKDNLGSILSVVDENGSKVFSAEYDAWGKQTVSVNTIGLIRGYGGHEMLNEFNLINMNGRVYDPVLGRFLSPDKYVQEGDNSQNYNSYSYCLNNPLKYADPSGDVFVLDDFIAITAMGAMMGAMNAAMSDKPIWKGALLGAASAAATYGIGSIFNGVGTFGHELLRAGAHGLSSGVFNALNGDNFWNGLISGAASSGIGSYAQSINLNSGLMIASTTAMGGIVAWATGGDFLQGALQGMSIGLFNHSMHDGDDNKTYRVLSDGTIELNEVVVVASAPSAYIINFAQASFRTRVSAYSLSIIRMSMVEAGIHSLTITSTARTPQEQVSAMYYNLKHKNYCRYAPAGRAVESLYPDKEAMLKEVYRQGPGRVSKHCADFNKLNVIDISPSSVSNPRAFHKSLINNVKISRVLDPWTKTKDPVFHIEIPQ